MNDPDIAILSDEEIAAIEMRDAEIYEHYELMNAAEHDRRLLLGHIRATRSFSALIERRNPEEIAPPYGKYVFDAAWQVAIIYVTAMAFIILYCWIWL